jgi:hypothetical protein
MTCADAANLMVGADGDTGEAEVISDADLARLLDRSELQPGDEAYCADELLGEVRTTALSCAIYFQPELQVATAGHIPSAPAGCALAAERWRPWHNYC